MRIHGSGVPGGGIRTTEHLWKNLERRPALKQLLDKGVFRYAAVLSGREQGKVQTLRRVVP